MDKVICGRCEGNGLLWLDGSVHLPTYAGATKPCPDCSGEGDIGATGEVIESLRKSLSEAQASLAESRKALKCRMQDAMQIKTALEMGPQTWWKRELQPASLRIVRDINSALSNPPPKARTDAGQEGGDMEELITDGEYYKRKSEFLRKALGDEVAKTKTLTGQIKGFREAAEDVIRRMGSKSTNLDQLRAAIVGTGG